MKCVDHNSVEEADMKSYCHLAMEVGKDATSRRLEQEVYINAQMNGSWLLLDSTRHQ